jgi:hypothetical protein
MKWLYANVGSVDAPFQERPEFSRPFVWILPSTYFSAC